MPERNATNDLSGPPAGEAVRRELNKLVRDVFYWCRNHMGTVSGAIAIGTTTTKVNLAAAITFLCGGVPTAKGITADLWTLTGGVLAISSFRKYRLLLDAAGAASVEASSDASTAAACDFATRPTDGKTIIGVVTIGTSGAVTFTPGTTALNAAGITTTYLNGSDSLELLAGLVPV